MLAQLMFYLFREDQREGIQSCCDPSRFHVGMLADEAVAKIRLCELRQWFEMVGELD